MQNILNTKFTPRQILFCLFLFVEFFFHRYTHHSWIFALEFMIISSFFLFSKNKIFLPSTKIIYFLFFAFFVTVLQAILNSSNLTEERWILRYINLLVFFFGFQFFSQEENLLSIKYPLIIFIISVSGLSLIQYLFFFDVSNTQSLGSFASRFWNISFYSQAMVLTLPFISYFKTKSSSKIFLSLSNVATLFILITLLASQSRASLIGLSFFLFLELWRPLGFQRLKLFFIFLISILFYFSVSFVKSDVNTQIAKSKQSSLEYRLNTIKKSIQMTLDNPTGVGSSNFTYRLFLYFDKHPLSAQPFELYKTPHNEPLQVLTEDGWAIFLLYLTALFITLYFVLRAILKNQENSPFPRYFICLIPEIFFHFPFDMYFPVILFSLSFPIFLKKNNIELSWSKTKSLILTFLSILILFVYWVRERKILPKEYAETYCSIFQDNFDICKLYFEDYYLENDFYKANEIIRPILKYQPYNFRALALDYSLGEEPRSQIAACLFFDLFNGEQKIPESHTSTCVLSTNLPQKNERFQEYSNRR